VDLAGIAFPGALQQAREVGGELRAHAVETIVVHGAGHRTHRCLQDVRAIGGRDAGALGDVLRQVDGAAGRSLSARAAAQSGGVALGQLLGELVRGTAGAAWRTAAATPRSAPPAYAVTPK